MVKFFVGMIFNNLDSMEKAVQELRKLYGESDTLSPVWKFDFTKYYNQEMGEELYRSFISFKNLIDPDMLPDIKLATNSLEETFCNPVSGNRSINLDPGYITPAKLVLASTKDYTHRIYIGKGIYAEVTLRYQDKKWCFWEWTYPDYKSDNYIRYFDALREIYKKQVDSFGIF
ncbi:MAG: DUF4416 family protein [Candidatus Brocadiae bacterium]|nr:DUF4416 family protein [Candidatus Brocadiia bacterium]